MLDKLLVICLLLVELFHAIAHVAVLTGEYSIQQHGARQRLLYFTSDWLSVVISSILLQNTSYVYKILVVFHSTVHVSALLHLTKVSETKFFEDVFELAEQRWGKNQTVCLLYILGTLADILLHIVNVFLLDQLITEMV